MAPSSTNTLSDGLNTYDKLVVLSKVTTRSINICFHYGLFNHLYQFATEYNVLPYRERSIHYNRNPRLIWLDYP